MMIFPKLSDGGVRMAKIGLIAFTMTPAGAAFADASTGAVDLERGESLYGRCTGCHQLDRNAMGPLHCGVVGRAAAAVENFHYSEAMRDSGIVWSPDALAGFLADPEGAVPGTKMLYAGVAAADDRRDLIAWLAWAAEHSDRCQQAQHGD